MEIKVNLPDGDLKVVNASQFGLDTEVFDNSDAMIKAFDYCGKNSGTKLVINKGTYHFRKDATLLLSGAVNTIIDGQGAEFVFSTLYQSGSFMRFIDCSRLELINLFIDWNWEQERLADLVRVVSKENDYIDFEFPEISKADPKFNWENLNQCDPVTFTPGCEGGREYWGDAFRFSSVENVADNVLRVKGGALNDVQVGDTFILRQYQFSTHAVTIDNCSDFSIREVTVYSAPGMAFLCVNGANHFEFVNDKVCIKPNTNRRLSSAADSLHIASVGGYYRVENCDFSGMGDDNINIDTVTTSVTEKISSTVYNVQRFLGLKTGDTVIFRNIDFSPVNFSAKVIKSTLINDGFQVEFDRELPDIVGPGTIVLLTTNTSTNFVVRNNYFHENRARGALLGAGDGIFENNTIYKTQGAAIVVSVDMYTAWSEGSGVENLVVRNNKIINANVNDWTPLIFLAAGTAAGVTSYPALNNIIFEGNEIIDCPSEAFSVCSSGHITIKNNTISNPASRKENKPSRGTIKIEKSHAITVSNNTWISSPYMANPGQINVVEPDRHGELVAENNIVK